ncbi:MAG: DUF4954 domain-containing protein [Bacteroidetes bacterium HGW-Bacteroidetes-5]|jgi:NDP-sugar pyrophosphorylase family protein/glutamine cyclotransferase|nr:MAG: DUF4954 domain-containing protein [Bacteroidetes bacterium HGW-Bacteroidetes-5]
MRNLSQHEIGSLIANHCVAEDWTKVFVSERFSADYVHSTRFSGRVVLGHFEKSFTIAGGLVRHSGIRNATIHNCEIGDNVLIENVLNHISNYTIGEDCYIQNVNVIAVEEFSTFGNNVRVSVLNEMGGREVPIYDKLSSSLAYIIALYRHKKRAIENFEKLIEKYARESGSDMGSIGKGVKILNTGTIKHVRIGDYAKIVNTSRLENGTVNSNKLASVYIGDSVIAKDFIFSSGSYVADAATVSKCFAGQSCHISHSFSAHDSLLFANCKFENGEACAVFAGPFTVSIHKSSLLIAGMLSFLNAGSGSNQSNHMYKLGPIHQGIIERGSKTTSDSYILWPAKVGAFSLVMGRHYRHSDTSDMPFSYLIEKSDDTYLIPGVNLRSVGTIRDAQKWPLRDTRTDPQLLDMINYNLLSPYTIQKMIRGRSILTELRVVSGETSETYTYRSSKIKNSSLRNGITLYEKAINKFFGNSLIKRLEKTNFENIDQVREQLKPTHKLGEGEWVDLSGLIAPKSEVDRIIEQVESGQITLCKIEERFRELHRDYYDMEWSWAYGAMQRYYNIDLSKITADEIRSLVESWRESVVTLDEMIYKDAMKEFSITSMIGFGVDGSEMEKLEDFESVRGEFESNPFISAVHKHIEVKSALARELLSRLSTL